MTLFLLLGIACSPTDKIDTQDTSGVDTEDTVLDTAPCCTNEPPPNVEVAAVLSPEHLVSSKERTAHNPLKGFMTSYRWGSPVNDFPDQMEFLYIPMKDLWNENGETLEAGLDPYLEQAASRSHHVVLRVYIDYPKLESGLPTYLSSLVSCKPHNHFGQGCSPDYDDPDLLDAMLGLIDALGERYDGDTRLGFVQVGLLGFWGEWHTWPHPEWFPTEETQEAILNAYSNAFETTQLQIRRAAANSVDLRMGFHDDSFAYSTIGEVDWFFLPGLEASGAASRWKEVGVGGEVRPELQSTLFSDAYVLDTYAQDPIECIEQTHASYLLNYWAFNGNGTGYVDKQREAAEDAALKMGYQFELTQASYEGEVDSANRASVYMRFQVKNTGVAPFYYPLQLVVQSKEEEARSSIDLRGLLPGEEVEAEVHFPDLAGEALDEPFLVFLDSPILQEGQQVSFATTTPWSKDAGPTIIQWSE